MGKYNTVPSLDGVPMNDCMFFNIDKCKILKKLYCTTEECVFYKKRCKHKVTNGCRKLHKGCKSGVDCSLYEID